METDEDKMIYKLTVHRNFIGWVINELNNRGISSSRTTGNDTRGDIVLVHPQDASRVKEIIRQIHNHYNN